MICVEKFKQMEIEKKKTRPTKRVFAGPMIRYHSLAMPLLDENKSKRHKDKGTIDLNMSEIAKIEIDE